MMKEKASNILRRKETKESRKVSKAQSLLGEGA